MSSSENEDKAKKSEESFKIYSFSEIQMMAGKAESDFKKSISNTRSKINSHLSQVPSFIIPVPHHETTVENIKRPFREFSESCQSASPYWSSVTKNHGDTIIATAACSFVGLSFVPPFKSELYKKLQPFLMFICFLH